MGSGLVQLGNFYLDGTKVKAQASITENRKLDRIKQEIDDILAQAEQADQEEDKLYGSSRGDQLPKDLCDPRKRLARLKQAKARLDSEQDDSDEDPPAESGNKIKASITDPDSRIMKDRKGFVQGYNAQVVVTAEWDISCITHNIMKLFRQNARVLA